MICCCFRLTADKWSLLSVPFFNSLCLAYRFISGLNFLIHMEQMRFNLYATASVTKKNKTKNHRVGIKPQTKQWWKVQMGMLCNKRPITTNVKYEISPRFVPTKPFQIKQNIDVNQNNNKLGCIQLNPVRVVRVQVGPFIFEETPLFWLRRSVTGCLSSAVCRCVAADNHVSWHMNRATYTLWCHSVDLYMISRWNLTAAQTSSILLPHRTGLNAA